MYFWNFVWPPQPLLSNIPFPFSFQNGDVITYKWIILLVTRPHNMPGFEEFKERAAGLFKWVNKSQHKSLQKPDLQPSSAELRLVWHRLISEFYADYFHQALDDVDDFATYPRFVSHWHQVGLPGTQGLNKISDKQVSAIKSPKMTSIRLIWQSTGIRRFMIYFSPLLFLVSLS